MKTRRTSDFGKILQFFIETAHKGGPLAIKQKVAKGRTTGSKAWATHGLHPVYDNRLPKVAILRQ